MVSGELKNLTRTWLKRVGIYHRLKESCVFDFYWRIVGRSVIDGRQREIEFYRELLKGYRKRMLIYDIGANHGAKTSIFLRLGAHVVSVEPDPESLNTLTQKFLKYRLRSKPVRIIGKAVSDKASRVTMFIDEPGSAKNTLSPKWVDILRHDAGRFGKKIDFVDSKKVETVTLQDLIVEHGTPLFIKIDVEGHEPAVLRGLHTPVPYLSYEVNLPEFISEGLECVKILGRLDPSGKFNYAIDCRSGLELDCWLGERDFCIELLKCKCSSIEVFWKTYRSV
jgi:FkbM family methyltransferase